MSYSHNVVIIIPESLQAVANAIARALDPDTGGAKTFTRLYTDGADNFFATSTPCVESFAATVQAIVDGQFPLFALVSQTYVTRWPEETPPSAEDCAAFVAAAVIRIDEPLVDVLTELGLAAVEAGDEVV